MEEILARTFEVEDVINLNFRRTRPKNFPNNIPKSSRVYTG